MAGDDDIRDPDDEPKGDNGLPYILALIAIAVGVVTVLSVVGIFVSRDSKPPPSGSTPMCTESCYGFLKLECPTNRVMGACFGWPGCGGNPHVCGKDQ